MCLRVKHLRQWDYNFIRERAPANQLLFIFFNLVFILIIFFSSSKYSFAASLGEGIQTYQKNVHLVPEHKQRLADDITRYRNADNLWDALREEFTLAHYENNPAVQDKIEWFMNNQDFLLRSATRAAPYLYYISQQVKKRHLPAELVLLPIVESGYNPYSLSNVGAAGIWQLMPGTASGFGIKRGGGYDGRRDVIASTRAALNYLAYLQSFFDGNWLLAIAAYNTGEGNVQAAIRRNIRNGLDTDFWSLPVAQQTKDYVPSLLALAVIISNPQRYPVYFPPVRNAPYLAQIDVGMQLNLKMAAAFAGISYTKMMQLNPGFSRLATIKKAPYKVVLPIENVEQFSENLARSSLTTPLNWLHYKVKTGDTLVSIAKKFATTPTEIRRLNHLSRNNQLRRGVSLLIPSKDKIPNDDDDEDEKPIITVKNISEPEELVTIAHNNNASGKIETAVVSAFDSAMPYTLQPGDTIYMVRNDDTLEKIANRFHVNMDDLKAANNLSSNRLRTGKQIVIPTHAPTSVAIQGTSTGTNLAPGDTIYMVRRGDTIENVAKKFKTSAAAIRLANLMERNSLEEGEKIVIPTHMRG